MKRKNLKKLALYLLQLPKNYEHFSMQIYLQNFDYDVGAKLECGDVRPSEVKLVTKNEKYVCGTVGCALGHAPLAGIGRRSKLEYWDDFSSRFLIDAYDEGEEWQWCFDAEWKNVDNTPQGAGKRILYMLDKELPENWYEQMRGRQKLCYKNIRWRHHLEE